MSAHHRSMSTSAAAQSAQEALFQIRGLCRDFQLHGNTVRIINQLDLDIYPGEWLALVGKSGSGKTTLLQLLGGLERPTAGKIIYDNRDLTTLSASALSQLRRQHFGFVFQSYHLMPELSALENAALPALAWSDNRRQSYDRAKKLLTDFGMAHRLEHRPQELSGGEQQRVAIARALINDPPVILADEPTGNLDPTAAQQVIQILQKLRQEEHKTIVMVTHDQKIADQATRKHKLG